MLNGSVKWECEISMSNWKNVKWDFPKNLAGFAY